MCAVSQRASQRPTRLVVPVPEIDGTGAGSAHHLLDPFLDAEDVDEGVVAELRELFADLVPFAYVLGDPARFPDGAATCPRSRSTSSAGSRTACAGPSPR